MRAALPLAALALAWAACSVSTEGAPCATAGTSTDCPSGQACGANLRCSVEAAGPGCITCSTGATRCETSAQACQATPDGACNAWVTTATCTGTQVCVEGPASCRNPYTVSITSPGDHSFVPKDIPVAVKVTLASASFPVPASVPLFDGGVQVASLPQTSSNGLVVTYGADWSYPGSDGAVVVLTAQAGSGATLATSPGISVTLDEQAPTLTANVTCSPVSCPRDGVLNVTATAADAHLVSVTVSLDLDGGAKVTPLSNGGSGNYQATLPLASWPFPFFQHTTVATIIATDAAGNATQLTPPTLVTRLRWSYAAGGAVTSPAVLPDGTVVVGVNTTTGQLQGVLPDGTKKWSTNLGSAGVPAAPSAGALVWAGSNDGNLYVVSPSSETLLGSCAGSAAGSPFTPAILPGNGSTVPDVAFAGYSNSEIIGAKTAGTAPTCNLAGAAQPVTAASALTSGFLTVPEGTTTGSLVPFTWSSANPIVLIQNSGGAIASPVQVPLTVTSTGQVVACATNGNTYLSVPATASTSTASIFTLPAFATGSPVVNSAGDLFIPASDNRVHRVTAPSGGVSSDLWANAPQLSGTPTGLALITADESGVFLLATVSTAIAGQVVAFTESGGLPQQVWPAAGEPPENLGPLSFPVVVPAASSSSLPTLYAGSTNGNLYAIVVDSALDTTSPWPKTYHDLRNTENASSPLP